MNKIIEALPFTKKPQAPIFSEDGLQLNRKNHPIVPRGSVAGTSLTLVVGIMAFLASITLGAVTLINDTAKGWQSDVSKEITIQIRPTDVVDMEQALDAVIKITEQFEGIETVTIIDQETMGRLLAPWLGSGLDLNELPVPRLITVTIDENNPPDLVRLKTVLDAQVPGANLDDHQAWIGRLTTMANATIMGGLLIFILMMVVTILTVIFATRGAMASNKHVIEVLHFVGAEQGYIAGQFQKHFMFLGLKGGGAGGIAAIVCFILSSFWASRNIADPTTEQAMALFGTFSIGLSGYLGTILLIFTIAILTALTSRYTVFHHIDALDGRAKPEIQN